MAAFYEAAIAFNLPQTQTMSTPLAPEEQLDEERRLQQHFPYESKSSPPKLTFGQQLVKDIDPDGVLLEVEKRAQIETIQDSNALQTMLYADLGSPLTPDIATAQLVFGDLLLRQFEIPQILLTWQMFSLNQCQLTIDAMAEQMKDKTLSGAERVSAGRARLEAVRTMNSLLTNLRTLAKAIGILKKTRDRSKKGVLKIPKNDAPKFD